MLGGAINFLGINPIKALYLLRGSYQWPGRAAAPRADYAYWQQSQDYRR